MLVSCDECGHEYDLFDDDEEQLCPECGCPSYTELGDNWYEGEDDDEDAD